MGLALTLVALYFVPAFIAAARGHHDAGAIFALNLFLGWTVLGWIIAFVWSCTAKRVAETKAAASVAPASPRAEGYCTQCGAAITADARFCPRCGVPAGSQRAG